VTERKKKSQVMLETSEKIVYAILSLEPIHLTQIAEETGLELPFVMEILMSLQLKNLVQTAGNNYFAIRL
jgi:DNA processing protein